LGYKNIEKAQSLTGLFLSIFEALASYQFESLKLLVLERILGIDCLKIQRNESLIVRVSQGNFESHRERS
jgi:hypothetical protein